MRLNFNAADYRVKLGKDEELIRQYLGLKELPQHHGYYYGLTSWYATQEEAEQACRKHAAKLRKKFAEYLREEKMTLPEWAKKRRKDMREAEKADARRQKEEDKISSMAGGKPSYIIQRFYRTGENTADFSAKYGNENVIKCHEFYDYRNGYAKSCKFSMTRRSFEIVVKKGWKVRVIGGLLTFFRGDFRRAGMPCEWIEQGRSIAEFTTVPGFLVRSEHIFAKNLAEAKKKSTEKRAKILSELLKTRTMRRKDREKLAAGTLMITFADSLAAGNCLAGTQNFKMKYEEETGRRTNSISISDLRKFGKKFGVEVFAEKVISYKISKIQ